MPEGLKKVLTTAAAGTDDLGAHVTDDNVFAAHEGGKLTVETTMPLDSTRALSIAYTPRGRAGVRPGRSRRTLPRQPLTRGQIAWWWCSPTVRRSWDWVTSAPQPPCRSWREKPPSSGSSPGSPHAARLTGRDFGETRVVIAGAGAAGIAVAEILLGAGVEDVIITDSQGTIHRDRDDLSAVKAHYAQRTNKDNIIGGIGEALEGADVFIGVSSAKVPEEAVSRMADEAIVFALSNPDPEIMPDVAARHAAVVATGRSDFPNQINNVLAFPGISRGALDAGARRITPEMKLAAATAIADVVGDELAARVVSAVKDAAHRDGMTSTG